MPSDLKTAKALGRFPITRFPAFILDQRFSPSGHKRMRAADARRVGQR
jgi:hypothetical protein